MNLSLLKYTNDEEAEIVREQFRKAFDIFQKEVMVDGDPILCQLHDAFGTFNSIDHNCLGCNFSDSTWLIFNLLRTYDFQDSITYSYQPLIILLYLLVERMDTFLNIIDLHKTYRDEHFKILVEIRKWANFIKHPKAFILTHHPVFSYEECPKNKELRKHAHVVIDRTFVNEYYSNDDKNEDLYKILENKENVLVIFPEPSRLIHEIAVAMSACVTVIKDNPVYRSVVVERTTFRNYWFNISPQETNE